MKFFYPKRSNRRKPKTVIQRIMRSNKKNKSGILRAASP